LILEVVFITDFDVFSLLRLIFRKFEVQLKIRRCIENIDIFLHNV